MSKKMNTKDYCSNIKGSGKKIASMCESGLETYFVPDLVSVIMCLFKFECIAKLLFSISRKQLGLVGTKATF